ncbi:leucine zipper domain-containing protein, partial [Pseudacidovorax intermedius]
MNSHKNARLTFKGRKLLVQRIATLGLMPAAEAAGISPRTARKWLQRFEQHGERGLLDRSSRPARTRSCLDAQLFERIDQLRRCRMHMRQIARTGGRSVPPGCRLPARPGLSCRKALDPARAPFRYERDA